MTLRTRENRELGAGFVEYMLLISLIVFLSMVSFTAIGNSVSQTFSAVAPGLDGDQ
jgi:Flp pilus assembly pilin Flp